MKQVEPNLAQINRKPNDGNNSKNAKIIFFLREGHLTVWFTDQLYTLKNCSIPYFVVSCF